MFCVKFQTKRGKELIKLLLCFNLHSGAISVFFSSFRRWLDWKETIMLEKYPAGSSVGSRFAELLLLEVSGTATQQVRKCGFRRISSTSDKAPKTAWLRPAKLFGEFFGDPSFNVFRNLGDTIFRDPRIDCALWLTVPCIFLCFSRNCC